MGRRRRFIPDNTDGVLVEVSARTTGAKALLVPTRDPRPFNETLLGVIGRAMEVARGGASAPAEGPQLELCGTIWLNNHFHGLLVVHDQQTLTRFMSHLMCNVSKEIGGRIRKWGGPMWQRRYDSIVVSDEPHVQWSRLKYLLANGVESGLVERRF